MRHMQLRQFCNFIDLCVHGAATLEVPKHCQCVVYSRFVCQNEMMSCCQILEHDP